MYKKFVETGIAQNIGVSGLNEAHMMTFGVTIKGIYSTYTGEQFEQDFKKMISELL